MNMLTHFTFLTEKNKYLFYLRVKAGQLVLLAVLLRGRDAQRDWTDRGHMLKSVEFWKVVPITFLDEKRLIFSDRTSSCKGEGKSKV